MEMETEMETEMEKGRQNYKLQSSRGEVSLVCNCYLARTVIIGGGTRGAGGATAPPRFQNTCFRPPQISRPEINQHWLVITFKHVL